MGVWKKTQCNFCALSCGLEMEVENNKIISVRPDPDSPRVQLEPVGKRGYIELLPVK